MVASWVEMKAVTPAGVKAEDGAKGVAVLGAAWIAACWVQRVVGWIGAGVAERLAVTGAARRLGRGMFIW